MRSVSIWSMFLLSFVIVFTGCNRKFKKKPIDADLLSSQSQNGPLTISKGLSLLSVNSGGALGIGNFCIMASGGSVNTAAAGSPVNGGLEYSWVKNGVLVTGQVKPCLLIPALTVADAGNYTVTVKDLGIKSGTSTVSSTAYLEVIAPAVAPTITKVLGDLSINVGSSLGVGQYCASFAGEGLVYSWTKDGVALPAQVRPCLLITAVAAADAGAYAVTARNNVGMITSSGRLTVLGPPVLAKALSDMTFNLGTALIPGSFCAMFTGETLTYSWTKDGVALPAQVRPCLIISALVSTDAGAYTVTASNSFGRIASSAKLSIAAAPAITKALSDLSVSLGQSLVAGTFCAMFSGSDLIYSWAKDGVILATQVKPCLLIPAVALLDAGSYTVTAKNSLGSISSSAKLIVSSAPAVSKSLADLSVNSGSALAVGTFCAMFTGDSLIYSWAKNGVLLPTQVKPCLLIPIVSASDAAVYTVTAKNNLGSISSSAKLIVISAPTVTKALANLTVNVGSALIAGNFCAMFSGEALVYSWSKNGVVLPTQIKPCLLLSAAAISDSGTYVLKASNAVGSISSSAVLTVQATPTAPVVSKPLAELNVNSGSALIAGNFCAMFTGESLIYSWTKDGIALPAQIKPCLLISAVSSADAGVYVLKAINSFGSAQSSAKLLVTSQAPLISKALVDLSVSVGSALIAGSFCSTFTGDNLVYSWSKDGVALATQIKPCLLVTSVSALDSGNYTLKATNSLGSISQSARLSVIASAPALAKALVDLNVNSGSALVAGTFCAMFTGDALIYSWSKDGVLVSSQVKPCLLIPSASGLDSGTYTVTAKNGLGVISSTAKLSVLSIPSISKALVNLSVSSGSSLIAGTFCAMFTGESLVYSWTKNGVILATQTKPCLLIPVVAGSDAGSYSVTASNAAGKISSAATLSVIAGPIVTKAIVDSSFNVGAPLAAGQFCAMFSGDALSYSWTKDGIALPSQVKPCLLTTALVASDAGIYVVKASNASGSATSTAKLSVISSPVLTKSLATLSINAGSALVAGSFCAMFSGEALVYSWTKDGVSLPAQVKPCLLISAVSSADAGNYVVKATNSAGSISSSGALSIVSVPVLSKALAPTTLSVGSVLGVGSFCAMFTGDALSYTWTKDGVALPAQVKPCLLISSAALTDSGNYTVTAKNTSGSVSSSGVLSIIAPPALTQGLAAYSVSEGGSLVAGNFCAMFSGSNLTYSWAKNGVALPTQVKPCLLINPVAASDAATYTVTAKNALASVSSSGALTVIGRAPAAVEPMLTGYSVQKYTVINSTFQIGFFIQLDRNVQCKFDISPGISYDSMAWTMAKGSAASVNGYLNPLDAASKVDSINMWITVPLDGIGVKESFYYVKCKDSAGVMNSAEFKIQYIKDGNILRYPAADYGPELLGYNTIHAAFASGNNFGYMRLKLDRKATCRAGMSQGIAFESMPYSLPEEIESYTLQIPYFGATTSVSAPIVGGHFVVDPNLRQPLVYTTMGPRYFGSWNYSSDSYLFVKCKDGAGKINPSDFKILFYKAGVGAIDQ